MSTLDQIAVTIELTLISIVEGFALQFLAESSAPVLHDSSMAIFVPYIAAGLLFLLVFWSQAILHAVSFIRWPVRIGHMFLYFLAAFVQVLAYLNLTDPLQWFFWWAVFTLITAVLYAVDLWIIVDSKKTFEVIPDGSQFLAEVKRRHLYEFKTLVPAALGFNLAALGVVYFFPALFRGTASAVAWLGLLQALISALALWDSVRNFKIRSALIGRLFRET